MVSKAREHISLPEGDDTACRALGLPRRADEVWLWSLKAQEMYAFPSHSPCHGELTDAQR